MKRAFSTVACQNLSYREIVDCAVEKGIDAIEVRLHKGNTFFDLSEEEVMVAKAYLEDMQITITDLGTGIALFDYEPDKILAAKSAVDLALMVNTNSIRLFLGQFKTRFSEKSKFNYEGIVESLKEICQYASEKGVEIWIETHNEFSTGKVLKELIEDVGYNNIKVIWDIIHPIEFGELPQETLKYLGDRIAHVHIKDGIRPEDPDLLNYIYCKLGEGELPIKEIVNLLEESGYEGYYSLEWENAWRPEIKDVFSSLSEILEHFNFYMNTSTERQ